MKPVMVELISFYFNGHDKEFITITNYGTIWTNSREKCRLSFNQTFLKLLISLLQENSYFTLGSMCFPQWIVISIGLTLPLLLQAYFSTMIKSSCPEVF